MGKHTRYLLTIVTGAFVYGNPAYTCRPNIPEGLVAEGHYKEALSQLDQEVKKSPNFYLYFQRASINLDHLKDKKAALADISNAIKWNPHLDYLLLFRAKLEEDAGNLKGALSDYSDIVRSRPNPKFDFELERNAFSFRRIAALKQRLGDQKGADSATVSAIKVELLHKSIVKKIHDAYLADLPKLKPNTLSQLLNSSKPVNSTSISSFLEIEPKRTRTFMSEVGDQYYWLKNFPPEGLQIRPAAHEKIEFGKGVKIQISGFSRLYKYSWGFLELVENPHNKQVESLIFRAPQEQLRKCNVLSNISDRQKMLEQLYLENSSNKYIRDEWARHLISSKRFSEALAFVDSENVLGLADLCFEAERYEDALAYVRKYKDCKIAGSRSDRYDQISSATTEAKVLLAMKRYSDAEKVISKLKLNDCNDGEPFLVRGKIDLALGKRAKALAEFERARDLFYDRADIANRDVVAKILAGIKFPKMSATRAKQNQCDDGKTLVIKH